MSLPRDPLDLNEGTLDPDPEPVSVAPMGYKKPAAPKPPAPPPPPVLPAAVSLTMAELQALISSAVTAAVQAGSVNDAGVAAAITQGLKEAKEPIPENKTSDGKSELNPLGDRDHPRPGLKCEMWHAIITDNNDVVPWYELVPEDLSAREQCALNLLEPIDGRIAMLGSDVPTMKVLVTARRNEATNAIEKLLIAVPLKHVMEGSDTKNFVPDFVSIVRQLTGHDFRAEMLPVDELSWVMAEQCAKRYVPPRKKVEAAA